VISRSRSSVPKERTCLSREPRELVLGVPRLRYFRNFITRVASLATGEHARYLFWDTIPSAFCVSLSLSFCVRCVSGISNEAKSFVAAKHGIQSACWRKSSFFFLSLSLSVLCRDVATREARSFTRSLIVWSNLAETFDRWIRMSVETNKNIWQGIQISR